MAASPPAKKTKEEFGNNNVFLSAREIAARWDCSPATVSRIAAKSGIKRFVLGHGKNAMVRFLQHDIKAYEASRAS